MFSSPISSCNILEYSENWSYISKTRYIWYYKWKPKQPEKLDNWTYIFEEAVMERVAWYQA